jgi:hypothetical protein
MKCWILKRVVVSVAFFATVQVTGLAQGLLSHGKEIALSGGGSSRSGVDGNPHPTIGISGAYGVWRGVSAFLEYTISPQGSLGTPAGASVTAVTQEGGGGARYFFSRRGRMVPYATVAGGYLRTTVDATGTGENTSSTGGYFGFGLGSSMFLGESWGIRPELRYQREMYSSTVSGFKASPYIGTSRWLSSNTNNNNVVTGSVSIFFQFGGEASSKK